MSEHLSTSASLFVFIGAVSLILGFFAWLILSAPQDDAAPVGQLDHWDGVAPRCQSSGPSGGHAYRSNTAGDWQCVHCEDTIPRGAA